MTFQTNLRKAHGAPGVSPGIIYFVVNFRPTMRVLNVMKAPKANAVAAANLTAEEQSILNQVKQSGYTAEQLEKLLDSLPKADLAERCSQYGHLIRNVLANSPGLDETETAALYYLFEHRETLQQLAA